MKGNNLARKFHQDPANLLSTVDWLLSTSPIILLLLLLDLSLWFHCYCINLPQKAYWFVLFSQAELSQIMSHTTGSKPIPHNLQLHTKKVMPSCPEKAHLHSKVTTIIYHLQKTFLLRENILSGWQQTESDPCRLDYQSLYVRKTFSAPLFPQSEHKITLKA